MTPALQRHFDLGLVCMGLTPRCATHQRFGINHFVLPELEKQHSKRVEQEAARVPKINGVRTTIGMFDAVHSQGRRAPHTAGVIMEAANERVLWVGANSEGSSAKREPIILSDGIAACESMGLDFKGMGMCTICIYT